MPRSQSICVRGSGWAPWLAALLIARFVADEPSDVRVVPSDTNIAERELILARPGFERIATAIGLDMRQIGGATPTLTWDRDIPFTPFGRTLSGVDMPSLLIASEIADWNTFNPAFSDTDSSKKGQRAYWINAGDLNNTLRKIAVQVGISTEDETESDIIVETEKIGPAWSSHDDQFIARVGAALAPKLPSEHFGLLIGQTTVMQLIRSWPDEHISPHELNFYARSAKRHLAPIEDMHALLSGHAEDGLRRRLWRETGQILPVDHDPFAKSEWIAAHLRIDGRPRDYSIMAETLTEDQINAHLKACRNPEVNHV